MAIRHSSFPAVKDFGMFGRYGLSTAGMCGLYGRPFLKGLQLWSWGVQVAYGISANVIG